MPSSLLSHEPAPVGIVGGGPCGLFTALLLARAGVACVLFERKGGPSTHPKAMGVSRRTAELFRQADLLAALERGALPLDGRLLAFWARSLAGEELGMTRMEELDSPFTPCRPLHVPQTWTEAVLLEALRAEPLAKVFFGCEVTAVTNRPDGARLAVLGRKDQRDYEFFFPHLIAADGASSQVRHALDIEAEGPGDRGHFLNVLFRADYGRALSGRKAVLYPALSETFFEFFVAVNGDDLWLMHHFLQPGETPADYPLERLAALVREASGLPHVPVEVLSVNPWVMSPKVALRFRQGRVFLVGDAAARLSPSGGLGMNTGLQSAHNLAWKLAAVLAGDASDSLLESYEMERRAASLATMRHTGRHSEEIFAIVALAMKGDWKGVRRAIAASRRGGSGLGLDLGLAYEEGAFVPDGTRPLPVGNPVDDYAPDARPGSRAPHLWVRRAGATISTLDLFGGRFTLLAGSEGAPWAAAPPPVAFFRNGEAFEDPGGEFERIYGITPGGAVLVRPDGVVAARFRTASPHPATAVREALEATLNQLAKLK